MNIIKINMLPRLLPVKICDEKFKEWNKRVSRFIWNGKKPRIRYRTLQLPKDRGGLALPYFKD